MGAREPIRVGGPAGLVIRLVILAVLPFSVAACTTDVQSPAEPGPTAVQPADWPDSVPFYTKGTLFAAWAKPNGAAGATWEVPDPRRARVAGEYGRMLESAGFRSTEWFMDGAVTGFRYRGHGMTVSVGTLEVDGVTSLHVDISP